MNTIDAKRKAKCTYLVFPYEADVLGTSYTLENFESRFLYFTKMGLIWIFR